jgi:hypothetical protein
MKSITTSEEVACVTECSAVKSMCTPGSTKLETFYKLAKESGKPPK